jgi:phosphatidylserine synthase
MSSTLRHYSFKDIQWTKRQPSLAIVLVALLVGAMFFFSRLTLLIVASTYTLHGVTLQLVRYARHRPASRTA